MAKEYQTFVRKYDDLTAGERDIFIKDLTPGIYKYNTAKVRAQIFTSPQPDSDVLWIRSETGVLSPEPWGIKVLKELPEDTVPGKPYSDVFAGLGWVK